MTEQQMPRETSDKKNENAEMKQWHTPVVRCFEESAAEFGGDGGQDVTLGS